MTTEEIETMLKDRAQECLKSKPTELKRLGIDEIAWVKGQGNYCAVLIDLDKSKLLGILDERTPEKVSEVLEQWGTEVLEKIEEVSIDLWRPYKNLVEKLMPNAQVVADRFHVMKQVNDELDRQRKHQKREAEKNKNQGNNQEILAGLTKSKYALLKNENSLNEKQILKLEQVKKVSPFLGKMHELKEEIRKVFDPSTDGLAGLFNLGNWLASAAQYFPESQRTIIRWFDEVIAYFDNRTTSGVVEGINNKLKLIKRSAYGFRNFDNFRIRCLLCWNFNC
jgi:transposase